jgi:hypothetical protein
MRSPTYYKKGNTAAIVSAVFVVLLVGYAVAHFFTSAAAPAQMEVVTSVTKAADFRVALNKLFSQHVALVSDALRSGYDGDQTFPAFADNVAENTKQLSDALAYVYGAESGMEFSQLWTSYIGYFVDYSVALKKSDKTGMDKAQDNLRKYEDSISAFFFGLHINLSQKSIHDLMADNVTSVKSVLDAYAKKDYAGSLTAEGMFYKQIASFADTIAEATVQNKPEMFK